jgi:hypothetical protein
MTTNMLVNVHADKGTPTSRPIPPCGAHQEHYAQQYRRGQRSQADPEQLLVLEDEARLVALEMAKEIDQEADEDREGEGLEGAEGPGEPLFHHVYQ